MNRLEWMAVFERAIAPAVKAQAMLHANEITVVKGGVILAPTSATGIPQVFTEYRARHTVITRAFLATRIPGYSPSSHGDAPIECPVHGRWCRP
jgi:hypothetical protein